MSTVRAAIYCRVSTHNQDSSNQLAELERIATLRNWKVVATYSDDGISGIKGRDSRPQLDAMLKAAARREFDLLIVWSVCRLGRSTAHLVNTVTDLNSQGVHLYFHQQSLDTTTNTGKLMVSVFGVFAEFERNILSERIKLGVAAARKAGKSLGRPTSINESTKAAISELYKKGMPIRKIARTLHCGVGSCYHTLKSRGLIAA